MGTSQGSWLLRVRAVEKKGRPLGTSTSGWSRKWSWTPQALVFWLAGK